MFNETTNDILKACLVGTLAVAFSVIPLEQFLGMEAFRGGMPPPYLIPLFLIYSTTALVLARMRSKLNVSKRGAFLVIFAFHYSITSFLPQLEGEFYLPDFPFLPSFVGGLIVALVVVSSIHFLWKPEDDPANDVGQQIRSYFSSRSWMSWAWRLSLVWILFYVLTMLFSIVALPLNQPYLDDAMNSLGMEIPSMGALFAITQFRSLMFLLVTLPLIVLWKSSRQGLFFYLALIMVIQYPLLGDGLAYFWPVMYRLIDGVVLILQVTAMSWLYANLLWKGHKITSANHQTRDDGHQYQPRRRIGIH